MSPPVTLPLPTCNRCRRRRKKCDNRLPDCSRCHDQGLDCVYFDDTNAREVHRRYIAALNTRVRELKDRLAAIERPSGGTQDEVSALLTPETPGSPSFVVGPSIKGLLVPGPHGAFIGQNLASETGLSVLSTAVQLGEPRFERGVLEWSLYVDDGPNLQCRLEDKLNRALVEHTTIHRLVEEYYLPIINDQWPILSRSQLLLDSQIRRLPIARRLFVCLAGAIAATHQARKFPEMHVVAMALRQWAGDLTDAVFLKHDGDALHVLLLLILYELTDPSRKLLWSWLGLACRMCIRLAWHRSIHVEENRPRWLIDNEDPSTGYSYEAMRRLFYILYQWERSACSILGRPTMLPDQLLESLPVDDGDSALSASFKAAYLGSKLSQLLASVGEATCPVSPQLIQFTSDSMSSSPLHDKLWLSLYPSVQHRCPLCQDQHQWFSDASAAIERAATSLLEMEHENFRQGRVVSIWLSAPYVFSAGSIIADLVINRRLQMPGDVDVALTRALFRCSSLLAAYAGTFPGAKIYYEIFTTFSEQAMGG